MTDEVIAVQLPLTDSERLRRESELEEGRLLRDEGMVRVQEAAGPEWNDRADFTIWLFASTGEEFTAEDVRTVVGDPPRPNAMGPRFAAAAHRKLIEFVRYQPATRAQLHAHPIGVWRGSREAHEHDPGEPVVVPDREGSGG